MLILNPPKSIPPREKNNILNQMTAWFSSKEASENLNRVTKDNHCDSLAIPTRSHKNVILEDIKDYDNRITAQKLTAVKSSKIAVDAKKLLASPPLIPAKHEFEKTLEISRHVYWQVANKC